MADKIPDDQYCRDLIGAQGRKPLHAICDEAVKTGNPEGMPDYFHIPPLRGRGLVGFGLPPPHELHALFIY